MMLDIETGKIKDFIKFGVGNLCMVTGGRNCGRVGTVTHIEKHKGSFDVCHVKDATGAPARHLRALRNHTHTARSHCGRCAVILHI